MAITCKTCGWSNADQARLCAACDAALAAICSTCGSALLPQARFCHDCGAAADPAEAPAPHQLRKTVTIVFADLVGSTSLQERLDPEAVRRVLTRFYDTVRAVVAAHEGQVVKFTGDGVMATFGIPVVREDDALRAVRAAATLVDEVERLNDELERDWGVRLRLRTGVNTGEVVVDSADGDVMGDPVNVAARLEQAAGEGEVLLGAETRRLVRHQVSLEPVPPLDLKGKGEPVPAFRLLAAEPSPEEQGRIEAPLVGRDEELARLRAAFYGAVAERACRLVTVIGSPGIGKTRLAHELARAVETEATVLEGRCEPTGEGITFAPVAEVLRAAAAIEEGDSTATARDRLAALLPDPDDREQVVERALGVLGAVPAASTEETFWAVRRVLEAVAAPRPLVVLLDDVHWGQPTFLDLIEHLVEWARDVPLLLVALARPELRDLREALAGGRHAADVIELDPLDEAESRTLVDGLLGRTDLPERLAERVLRVTEGNPLFVGETVRMLVDEGILRREGDTWAVAAETADVAMPPTIHALIAARLERLLDDERAVVERASVIGKQFYRGAVAELSSPPVRRGIDDHLETLRRKEFVEPEGTYWIDEPVFRFHHVLIRDAAYRSLLKEARAELHEQFAEWLEAKAGDLISEHEEIVAFHLERAHQYRRELGPLDEHGRELGRRAAGRLAAAGRRALAREDLPAAANLLGRALEGLDADSGGRAELLVDLAEALLSAGDPHGAAPAVDALRESAGDDPRLRALAAVYAGQLMSVMDSARQRETVDEMEAAARELSDLGDEAGVAKARHVQAAAFARLGQVAAAEGALDVALAAARRSGDTRRVSAVLSGAPPAALWGPSPVVRASGRCLDVVRILRMTPGNRHLEAAALSCQAVLEAMRGRVDVARAMLDGSRATFEELGLAFELLETEVQGGIVELLGGDVAAAERRLRAAHEGFAGLGAGAETERAAALLARSLLEQGRDGEADALTSTREEDGGEDLKATIGWCGVRAQVLARRGDHAAAEELARRGAAMAESTDALTDHADARMALAAVLREAGREDEAAEEARRALRLYEAKENVAGARRASAFAGVQVSPEQAAPSSGRARRDWPSQTWRLLVQQLATAQNERDRHEFARGVTEDALFLNHRHPATWEETHGPDGWMDLQEGFWQSSPDVRYGMEFLEGDELVTVTRGTLQGHLAAGGGEWGIGFLAVLRLREDRLDRVELFGEGDLDAARACAERLRHEAVAGSPTWRVSLRLADAFHARDWIAFRSCLVDDLEVVDHRIATPLGRVRDIDTYVAQVQALVEHAGDVRMDYERLGELDPVGAGRAWWRGHLNEGGGAFETAFVLVGRRRGDRFERIEVFDSDDDVGWFGRMGEMLGERGAAIVAGARMVAAHRDRDWDTLGSGMLSPDVVLVDHRQAGVGEVRGPGAIVDLAGRLVEIAPAVRGHVAAVLDATSDVVLVRVRVHGHTEDGGDFELHYLQCGRFVDGVLDRLEFFDADDEPAARRRFAQLAATEELLAEVDELRAVRSGDDVVLARREGDRFQTIEVLTGADEDRVWLRMAELLGERGASARAWVRWRERYHARDWEGLAATFTDDAVVVDRRHVGMGEIRGREAIAGFSRGLVELAPDARQHVVRVLAATPRLGLMRNDIRGHAADGGRIEVPYISLGVLRDGLWERLEMFDPADEDQARRRFEELECGP